MSENDNKKDCEGYDLTTSPGANQGPPILNKSQTYSIPVEEEIYMCFNDDSLTEVKEEQEKVEESTESVAYFIDELFS